MSQGCRKPKVTSPFAIICERKRGDVYSKAHTNTIYEEDKERLLKSLQNATKIPAAAAPRHFR